MQIEASQIRGWYGLLPRVTAAHSVVSGFECLALTHQAFKPVEVVADGHGQGEQFLKSFVWVGKFEADAAGLEADAGREAVQRLIDYGGGGLDQQLRLFEPLLAQLCDESGDFAAAFNLMESFFAFSHALEAFDERIAVGEAAAADAVSYTGRHDLLGASPSDAEEEFEGGAIDIRMGVTAKIGQNAG